MSNSNGGYATRDQILAIDDLSFEDVSVDEWGMTVRVRELTGSERGAFEKSISKISNNPDGSTNVQLDAHNIRVQLCAMTMVDGDGKRLFKDSEVRALGEKSARAITRIFDVSAELSGISEKSAEDALGESEAVLSEESSSVSV